MNEFIKSIVLGIIEGLTEFLPVSSTGHLIIVNEFIGFTGEFAHMFDIVIQFGAILSVILYFRRRLFPFYSDASPEDNRKIIDLWMKTIIGVIPALVIGAAFGKYIKEYLFNPRVVSIALVIGGIILIVLERSKRHVSVDTVASLGYGRAFAIGLFQCLAMIPGTSRSAATIIGAMTLGCSRVAAAEFSFFLSVPTMAAASAYSFLKAGKALTLVEYEVLAVGFIVSFLVAWAVIAAFMRYITRRDFQPFGYYRIVLGILVYLYFYCR